MCSPKQALIRTMPHRSVWLVHIMPSPIAQTRMLSVTTHVGKERKQRRKLVNSAFSLNSIKKLTPTITAATRKLAQFLDGAIQEQRTRVMCP